MHFNEECTVFEISGAVGTGKNIKQERLPVERIEASHNESKKNALASTEAAAEFSHLCIFSLIPFSSFIFSACDQWDTS